jgi:hypothetical protein
MSALLEDRVSYRANELAPREHLDTRPGALDVAWAERAFTTRPTAADVPVAPRARLDWPQPRSDGLPARRRFRSVLAAALCITCLFLTHLGSTLSQRSAVATPPVTATRVATTSPPRPGPNADVHLEHLLLARSWVAPVSDPLLRGAP